MINPSAGRGRAAAAVERLRSLDGLDVRVPASAADTTSLAREAASRGDDRVIVVGGDGTWNRAAAGLAGSDCALGLIPAGTGNDLSRAMEIDLDPLRAVDTALHGPARRVDLGRVNGRPFLGVACTGFDGEVLRLVERRGILPRGPWIYPIAVVRALLGFVPPRVAIDWEDESFEGPVVLAAVANSPLFGGGMRIAPPARMDDGLLDLVIVKALSRPALLRAFPRIYGGRHLDHPAVIHRRVRRVTVRSDSSLKVHGDGEPLADTGDGRVKIEVFPGSISVVGSEPSRPGGADA